MTENQNEMEAVLFTRYFDEFTMINQVFPCLPEYYDIERKHIIAMMYVRSMMTLFEERTLKSFLIHLNYFLNECNESEVYELSRKVHNLREWATCASVLIATYGGKSLDQTLSMMALIEKKNIQLTEPMMMWDMLIECNVKSWGDDVTKLIDMIKLPPINNIEVGNYVEKNKPRTCSNCLFDCYLPEGSPGCAMWQERNK